MSLAILVEPVSELLISIVSHRQGALVARLLEDLQRLPLPLDTRIVLTLNLEEDIDRSWPVDVIRNPAPRGFGANHNAAFRRSPSRRFCVLNPDLRLPEDPFPLLLSLEAGVVAPAVVDEGGALADSARRLPTPGSILAKALRGHRAEYDYGEAPFEPDWVAGMFMLCDSAAFAELGGFDERYFLYYEDVDLCCRMRLAGRKVLLEPRARVVHEAQRASHRELSYLARHLGSMLRFFASPVYRRARCLARNRAETRASLP